MVFTRDSDAGQGKRLKIGDTIPFETDLFLLAPEKEDERIRSSFTDVRRVGIAGKRTAMFKLVVFETGSARRMHDGREESNILKHAVSKSMILEAPRSALAAFFQ